MSRLESNDQLPGAPFESRRLQDGSVLWIIPIAARGKTPAARFVVRCDGDGKMYAALADARTTVDP
jgi:hypothetical protein